MMKELRFERNGIELIWKEEKGEPVFEIESVARHLGFTRKQGKYENIRWDNINNHMKKIRNFELGKNVCLQSVNQKMESGMYISEPELYMLTMKASTNNAMEFQWWLSSEVVPSIRKHGGYIAPGRDAEFLKSRNQGKTTRVILQEQFYKLKTELNDPYVSANYTNLIYITLFNATAQDIRLSKGLEPQGDDTRDICFDKEELQLIEDFEKKMCKLINKYMVEGVPYNMIYNKVKVDLMRYKRNREGVN